MDIDAAVRLATSSTSGRKICPNAATTIKSGRPETQLRSMASGRRSFSGCIVWSPRSWARALTGGASQLPAPSRRPVGLRDHSNDLIKPTLIVDFDQPGPQAGHSELRRTHENYANHCVHFSTASTMGSQRFVDF